jgi:gluconokinase
MILIITGVSGSGKTTVGRLLAEQLGWDFVEGDDHHPDANIRKMAAGIPLDDSDRQPWLERLERLIRQRLEAGHSAVLSCSCLKASYRRQLQVDPKRVLIVYLAGSPEQISRRLRQRRGHYMPAGLLQSQFDSLQTPQHSISVSIDQSPRKIVESI